MEKGLDATLSAGLSSAVYGTDFATSLRAGVVSAFVDLASMDVQNAIGANFAAGTAGSWASHLALGCLVASATGADCSAGMVGAATEQLFVAGLKGPRPPEGTPEYDAWKEENSKNLAFASAIAGYLFSGGKGQNVTAASTYAVSAFQNNYLTRAQYLAFAQEIQACELDDEICLSRIAGKYADLSQKQNAELLEAIRRGDVNRIRQALRDTEGIAELRQEILEGWDGPASDIFERVYQNGTSLDYNGTLTTFDLAAMDGLMGAVLDKRLDPAELVRIAAETYGESALDNQASGLLDVYAVNALAKVSQWTSLRNWRIDPSYNLASPERTRHILYGDGPNSGGHLWPGQPGKTAFPESWDANKVMRIGSEIATDPNLVWKPQTGNGGLYTKSGKPARFVVTDGNGKLPVVDGVPVRVVLEPAGEGIITLFPDY